MLSVYNHAVATGNDKELDTALNALLAIVQDSPLKDFETFRKALLDGREIEI
jgi:hypothetical protein